MTCTFAKQPAVVIFDLEPSTLLMHMLEALAGCPFPEISIKKLANKKIKIAIYPEATEVEDGMIFGVFPEKGNYNV